MKTNPSYKVVLVALLAAQNLWAAAPTNHVAAPAQVAAAFAPVDYSTYAPYIARSNIFDPARRPVVGSVQKPPGPVIPPRPPQPASFSLVGIVGYSEGKLAGAYAFFDGTSQLYRKTVRLNGDIAVFKVSDIAADSVTLTTGTNSHTVLKLGDQLHEDGKGGWLTANGVDARYNTSANANSRYNRNNNFGNQNTGGRGGRQRNTGGGFGGNNNNVNYNNNNFGGGNTRGRNTVGGGIQTFDNTQTQQVPNAGAQDFNFAPGDMPQDFIAPQDFFNQPADPGQQDN